MFRINHLLTPKLGGRREYTFELLLQNSFSQLQLIDIFPNLIQCRCVLHMIKYSNPRDHDRQDSERSRGIFSTLQMIFEVSSAALRKCYVCNILVFVQGKN